MTSRADICNGNAVKRSGQACHADDLSRSLYRNSNADCLPRSLYRDSNADDLSRSL